MCTYDGILSQKTHHRLICQGDEESLKEEALGHRHFLHFSQNHRHKALLSGGRLLEAGMGVPNEGQ